MYSQRGLDAKNEQKSAQLLRDVRPLAQKVNEDFFQNSNFVGVFCGAASAGCWVFPAFAELFVFLAFLSFLIAVFQKPRLPFRAPMSSGIKDHNDWLPGTTKPRKARGIYYFGNQKDGGGELWFHNDDMRTHVLIFGSTGSGKTEALVSLAFNALVQSSGLIYVDGKGDNSLFAKIFSMVKYMGREDDLLLINFMTGARDIIGPQEKRISNTLNPFANGSSSMLSNLIVSMMDSSSSSGDGDMWKGRAISFVEGLMKVLVAMRDSGYILLDANVIRNYFGLDRIEAMVMDKVFIRDKEGEYPISIEHVPPVVMEPIKNYLFNLPGYNKERKGNQVSQVWEQHGYITMQLTRVFTSLADTYGHILRTRLAEVDLKDVVLNRRILVVLLPALEKSPDELSNLGKIIIASLKSMMAAGLGDEVEGTFHEVVTRKPTNAATPFLCVLDEYGYYAVKGFAVVPAQARSLGFSVIFAGQDLPAFQKASKEEAASIGANTNIKVCMKLEDPQETWEFFSKTAGESYVTQVESFAANTGSVTSSYMDTKSAKVEKRARVDLLDLKEQDVGEAHIFFKSKIVRAKMFYANPKPVKAMRLNQFLMVDLPKDADLYTLVKGIEDFEAMLQAGLPQFQSDANSCIEKIASLWGQEDHANPIERAANVLVQFADGHSESDLDAGDDHELATDSLNIFMEVDLSQYHLQGILDGAESYSQPLLSRRQLGSQLEYVFRLLGTHESEAKHLGSEIVQDIAAATYYYPPTIALPRGSELAQVTQSLYNEILAQKQHSEASQDQGDNA